MPDDKLLHALTGPQSGIAELYRTEPLPQAQSVLPVQVLHLMTQDDQPYGSERRCCERCGIMIWSEPRPAYTDDRLTYSMPPTGYVACNRATHDPGKNPGDPP